MKQELASMKYRNSQLSLCSLHTHIQEEEFFPTFSPHSFAVRVVCSMWAALLQKILLCQKADEDGCMEKWLGNLCRR